MTSLSKTLLITTFTVCTAGVAFAQDSTGGAPGAPSTPTAAATGGAGSKTIGADAAFVLPLGDYADGTDFALGVFGRFEYGVNDALSVTGRVGYLYNKVSSSNVSIGMIPVLVGASYKIGPSGLAVFGELGLTNIRVSLDNFGSDSRTEFSVGGGAGYQAGKLEARVGFFMPGSISNGSSGTSTTLYGLMASVGYNFASL